VKYFGTAGIRGRYPSFVSPDLAFRLGVSVANHVGRGSSINIAWDTRTSSKLLALSAASGVMAGGSNAMILGILPTPALAFSVPRTRAKAGIMITASHNPPHDNGLKVFDDRGMEYTEKREEKIEELMEKWKEGLVEWSEVGDFSFVEEALQLYVEELVARFEPLRDRQQISVVVDCANGAASNVTPLVLRKLGARVYSVNCNHDGFFPGRHPEPRPDVLLPFKGLLDELGAEMYLAHDGDADRLGVMTPKHGFVKQDYLIAIYAMSKLREKKGKIIISPDVGNSVYDVAEELGGEVVVWKLGKLHEKLEEHPDAVLVAEPWKLIDPTWGPWVDGIYQAAFLLSIVSTRRERLDDIIESIPRYYWARGDASFSSHAEKSSVYSSLVQILESIRGPAKSVLKIDGLRVSFDDASWFLVRASGTEPKIRFYLEAKTKTRFEAIKGEILAALKQATELQRVKLVELKVNEGY